MAVSRQPSGFFTPFLPPGRERGLLDPLVDQALNNSKF